MILLESSSYFIFSNKPRNIVLSLILANLLQHALDPLEGFSDHLWSEGNELAYLTDSPMIKLVIVKHHNAIALPAHFLGSISQESNVLFKSYTAPSPYCTKNQNDCV